MHPYHVPDHIKLRGERRYGMRDFPVDPRRTALVVIDMQNHFVAPGFPSEVPTARSIIPRINTAAASLRAAGGHVVWVQTTATGALESWGNHHRYGLSPEGVKRRLASLDEAAEGFKLYASLETSPDDLYIKKIKFSALNPESSSLQKTLRDLDVELLFIAGTLTNVCCDSTARDGVMFDYRVVMLSDANAALSDEEHAGALNTFQMFFGRVMTTEEAIKHWQAG